MSCIRCDGCDRIVDTDHDVEGVWEDSKPFRFWCSSCLGDLNNTAMLAALKAQDPEMYAELMEV